MGNVRCQIACDRRRRDVLIVDVEFQIATAKRKRKTK
jgi:hypothetical protein